VKTRQAGFPLQRACACHRIILIGFSTTIMKGTNVLMKKMTLNLKLLLGGIVLVLIPIVIVGSLSIHKSTDALKEAFEDEMLAIAKGAASMVDVAMNAEIAMAREIAHGNSVIDVATLVAQGGSTEIKEVESLSRKLLTAMKEIGGQYENIIVADSNGVIYADGAQGAAKGISLADRDYFKTARAGKPNVGQVVKSRASGNPIVPVASPIKSPSGEVVGVAAVIMKVDGLIERIAGTKVGEMGYAFMVDKEGTFIAHPRKDLIMNLNIKTIKGMESIAEKSMARQEGIDGYRFEGIDKTGGFAPVPSAGWSVVTTIENDEFLAPIRSIRNWILLLGSILLTVSMLAVYFFARGVSKPIMQVVGGLDDGAGQVASASSQVSSASQQLAEGASEQAAAIEETSSSIEELSSMVKQNAENAVHANRLMDEAKRIVERASQSMGHLNASMEEISTASQDTQKIIKTIDEIAFQTNLLALNAAVEAARAGEAGAGFAVVADEVRNLAMRAADAAKNTAGLIEATVKKVQDGSQSVATTNREFSEIAVSVNKSGELVGEIAAASSEQAQGIQQISHAVAEMEKVVQRNSATAEESAAAAEEMNAQAEQMKAYVAGLTSIVGGGGKEKDRGKGRSIPTPPRGEQLSRDFEFNESRQSGAPRHAKLDGNGNGKPRHSAGNGGQEMRPERMIPFDGDEIKDF
jgi:methyl-accepting chemotaxis protein